ncbi:MAG: hypothetical protein JNJ84_00820, partial [Rhodobacteraceae bacterium]|nr:hypothetical protein [Paracoccaceae bacterium]
MSEDTIDLRDGSSTTAFAYLDTNVVSILANPENEWFLSLLIQNGIRPVVSDIVLTEVKSGKDEREATLFERFPFHFIKSHAPLHVGKTTELYTTAAQVAAPTDQKFLEDFLSDNLLWASGNPNAPSMGAMFQSLLTAVIGNLRAELENDADPLAHMFADTLR